LEELHQHFESQVQQEVQRRLKPIRSVEMMLEHREELLAAEAEFKAVLLDVRAQLEEFRREL
jgi:hypothetical protein